MIESIVEAVFYHADQTPDKLCLADDIGRVNYREYKEIILRYAACFTELGLKKKDTVVVEAHQTIDYLAIELALQLLGVIFVPVEHNCASEKICSFIERAEAKAAIIWKDNIDTQYIVYTYEQLKKLCINAQPYMPECYPPKEDICEILFSTGTTGKEKGIVLTHSNNIALAENVIYGVEMQCDNVEMIPSPMNHSHGLRRYYANMYNGSTVILLSSIMNMRKFFQNIDEYGVNSIDLVPTALSVMLKLSKDRIGNYKEQLRYIQFGAAPMMEADQKKICQLLPHTRLYNFYGSTESGCICIYNFNCDHNKKQCIGKSTRNAKIVIVDDEHRPIESSATNTGLLASCGNMNMLRYWQDSKETEKVLQNGIIYTNDIAYYDEDGDIILVGRKGDVINVGGMKVTPVEVESAALACNEIEDCICIAVNDPMTGHALKLLVVLKDSAELDGKKLRNYLMSKLESYKVPMQYEQVDQIARTYNGKLNRKAYQS